MPACDWEPIGCDGCSEFSTLDDAQRQEIQAWAVNRLWLWTHQRFGPCPVTMHNDSPECCGATLEAQLRGIICLDNEIVLPGPISEPISIVIDGEDLDPCLFHVDDYNILVRDDGGKFVGDWEIVYLLGEAVPPGGGIVAGILAREYAKSMCGDSTCRLPKRITSITRQGLTMGLIDNFGNLKDGYTGIWEIDDWIAAQNEPAQRSSVFSPDIPRYRTTTWTCDESS
jgi:hypothetical protein